ncbi:hypothetical protein D9M72_436360 [compost metagenome]
MQHELQQLLPRHRLCHDVPPRRPGLRRRRCARRRARKRGNVRRNRSGRRRHRPCRRREGRLRQVQTAVHRDPVRCSGRGQADRARRVHLAAGDPLGRPHLQHCSGLRPEQPDGRRPGTAVRLQQRLLGHPGDSRQQGPPRRAVREPRVHQREHHVPGHHAGRGGPRCGPGGTRPVRGGAGAEEQEQAVELRQGRGTQPPLPEQHGLRTHRAGCRILAGEDHRRPVRPRHQGHAGQLRRRHHPVGHHPLRRRELQRLLCLAGHVRFGPPLRADFQGHRPPVGTGRRPLRHPQVRL